jgi:hypothetical protein
MHLKRWLVAVSAATLLMGLWAAPVLADEDDGVDQPRPKRTKPAKRAKKPRPVQLGRGTPLAGALAKMELDDETKTKVGEALKAWAEKAKADRTELMNKQKELRAQLKEAGKDKAKRAETLKQMKELKRPTAKEQYASAKAAVQGILSEEQMGKLDELTVAGQKEHAARSFAARVGWFKRKGVELSEEQQTQVEAEKAKVVEAVGKVEAGDSGGVQKAIMAGFNAVKKDVLTEEQKAKIAPAKRGQGKARPNKQGRQKPKQNDEGGTEAVVGEED